VVDAQTIGEIGPGMVVLAAIERDDAIDKIHWMAEKLSALRIFRSADGQKHFDQDIRQIEGSMLIVSNFTVAAETRKGRRPSLDRAADLVLGEKLFTQFL